MPKHLIGNWSSLLAAIKPFADSASKAADILPKPASIIVKGIFNGTIKVLFPATTVVADNCCGESPSSVKFFGAAEEYQKKWRYKWYSLAQLALNTTSFSLDVLRYFQDDTDENGSLANASYFFVALGVFLVAIRDIQFKDMEDAANQAKLAVIKEKAQIAEEKSEDGAVAKLIPHMAISAFASEESEYGSTGERLRRGRQPTAAETKATRAQTEAKAIAEEYRPARWLF